jgi:hypothetical protein
VRRVTRGPSVRPGRRVRTRLAIGCAARQPAWCRNRRQAAVQVLRCGGTAPRPAVVWDSHVSSAAHTLTHHRCRLLPAGAVLRLDARQRCQQGDDLPEGTAALRQGGPELLPGQRQGARCQRDGADAAADVQRRPGLLLLPTERADGDCAALRGANDAPRCVLVGAPPGLRARCLWLHVRQPCMRMHVHAHVRAQRRL